MGLFIRYSFTDMDDFQKWAWKKKKKVLISKISLGSCGLFSIISQIHQRGQLIQFSLNLVLSVLFSVSLLAVKMDGP